MGWALTLKKVLMLTTLTIWPHRQIMTLTLSCGCIVVQLFFCNELERILMHITIEWCDVYRFTYILLKPVSSLILLTKHGSWHTFAM